MKVRTGILSALRADIARWENLRLAVRADLTDQRISLLPNSPMT
jgi:hypothetical protein